LCGNREDDNTWLLRLSHWMIPLKKSKKEALFSEQKGGKICMVFRAWSLDDSSKESKNETPFLEQKGGKI
jgi:hypothetical protein